MSETTSYRAAYWTPEDRAVKVLLTGPHDASLDDAVLDREALHQAGLYGLDLSEGAIEIGDSAGGIEVSDWTRAR